MMRGLFCASNDTFERDRFQKKSLLVSANSQNDAYKDFERWAELSDIILRVLHRGLRGMETSFACFDVIGITERRK